MSHLVDLIPQLLFPINLFVPNVVTYRHQMHIWSLVWGSNPVTNLRSLLALSPQQSSPSFAETETLMRTRDDLTLLQEQPYCKHTVLLF